MIQLSVIIVNWNTQSDLQHCLQTHWAACDGINGETIVVDNASSDGSVDWIKKEIAAGRPIHLIANDENRGFVHACNQGMRAAQGQNILLLNPDTLLFPDAYRLVMQDLSREEAVGVLGIANLNLDQTIQPSTWPEPSLWRQAFESFFMHRLFSKYWRGEVFLSGYFRHDHSRDVGMVLGSFFWITRSCYEAIGGFDARIFMFAEDLDYCMRARRRGFRVRFFHAAKVIHLGNRSAGRHAPLWRVERTVVTLYYVLSKVHGRMWLLLFNALQIAGFTLRQITSRWRGRSSTSGYAGSDPGLYRAAHQKIFSDLMASDFEVRLSEKAGQAL